LSGQEVNIYYLWIAKVNFAV